MQFIKKNYEKILLGLVLAGLVVAAVFLLFLVSSEKQAQAERRSKILEHPVKQLAPPDLALAEESLKRVAAPVFLVLSDTSHKLFNPERWQKRADGPIMKMPAGSELTKLEVTQVTNLYFTVSLDSINASESGARYGIKIEMQAATKPGLRAPRTFYLAKGEKKEYGEKKESFILDDVQGPPDAPNALVLVFSDSDRPVTINKDRPFRRVDGHMADLKYPPDNDKKYPNRRANDSISGKILVAGEEYNIVTITENEVVLQGKNQKKWTIKYNPSP